MLMPADTPDEKQPSALLAHTWTVPLLLGLLSSIGLITALVDDSFGDWISWLTLSVPLVAVGYFWWR
ncbi:MAG: hypothetical protein AAF512_13345 [Pseudomonadota bacterium]